MSLPQRLSAGEVLYMRADVTHARRGRIKHAFRYDVDYVLLSPEAEPDGPMLFGRDRFNLFAHYTRDHGGKRGAGDGAQWAWAVFSDTGIARTADMTLGLLAQPRFLGFGFNPVSFWLLWRADDLIAVVAEVNNTFGQRHSYLCTLTDCAPITPRDTITAQKVFHVSPFQDISGEYRFSFNLHDDRATIRIRQIDGENGLEAAMSGPIRPLTNKTILAAALRRPGGALRVVFLIYWNALRLKLKGAPYRPLPAPPDQEIS